MDEDEFVVRESSLFNYIIAAAFWIFFYSFVENWSDKFLNLSLLFYVSQLSIIPAIFFTVKGFKRKERIRVNRQGIFYNQLLVTDWDNFESAYITQDEVPGSIRDNFVLMLEYNRAEGCYRKKIYLTNTQDKSEEEVLAAIKHFGGME